MKKYITVAVLVAMFLGTQAASAFGEQFITPISAVSTNLSDPSAPFMLSGFFALPGGSSFGSACFQIRLATSATYANDCDTEKKTLFATQGSVVGGAAAFGSLAVSTNRLLPGTTYFYRISVTSALAQNSSVVIKAQSSELSFTTPPAPVTPPAPTLVPTPAPVPVQVVVPALAVTPDSTQLTLGAGISNQKLASFSVNVTNEPLSVGKIVIHISAGGVFNGVPAPATSANLTNVTLVDAGGRILAGPFDVRGTSDRTVTFTDPVVFPLGLSTYAFKGTVPTNVFPNQTLNISTNLGSDWGTVRGVRSGKTVALSGAVQLKPVIAKIASLDVSLATPSTDRPVLAGSRGATIETYTFNAIESGEDLRFSSLSIPYIVTNGGLASDLANCQLFDGATVLTTGVNSVNPPALNANSIAGLTQFNFDRALTVTEGTTKNLVLKCDISSAARGTYSFDLANSPATVAPIGGLSARAISAGITPTLGGTVTAVVGALSLANDTLLSPASQNVQNGTNDFRVGVIKFHATNEPIVINRIGFALLGTSSPQSVVRLTVTDNGVIVGTAVFAGNSRNATSTLFTPITVPQNGDKQLGVKVDFARVGPSLPGVLGDKIIIGVTSGINTQGTGTLSGNNILATGSATFNTFTIR